MSLCVCVCTEFQDFVYMKGVHELGPSNKIIRFVFLVCSSIWSKKDISSKSLPEYTKVITSMAQDHQSAKRGPRCILRSTG